MNYLIFFIVNGSTNIVNFFAAPVKRRNGKNNGKNGAKDKKQIRKE